MSRRDLTTQSVSRLRRAVEHRFHSEFSGSVKVVVTDHRVKMVYHSMKEDGTLDLRLNWMFLGAPEPILEALVDYVVYGDVESGKTLQEYILANEYRKRAWKRVPQESLRVQGEVYNLSDVLSDVSNRYFKGEVGDINITWGRRTKPRNGRRRTIKLGSYSPEEHLIRLHPVLDSSWVPYYFISYVVYHELLHHILPDEVEGGRFLAHSPTFKAHEREFKYYDQALKWERRNLGQLLRS